MRRNDGGTIDRRCFFAAVAGVWSFASQPAGALTLGKHGCRGDHPLHCLRRRKLPTLVALVDAHLHALWRGCPHECPRRVAEDMLRYLEYLPLAAQQAICLSLSAIELRSLLKKKRRFCRLRIRERMALLNQGELPCRRASSHISWDEDYPLHTAVTTLCTLIRLVVNSRLPARQLMGLRWSPQCRDLDNLVHMPAPEYPDLRQQFDVCVIGSGAGGAVVAALAAEAGKRVLIIEEGEWISPDALVQRIPDERGRMVAWPARDDEGLMHLFQGAGFNLAGRLLDPETDRLSLDEHLDSAERRGLTFYGRLKATEPTQAVNLLQARVVGGGPYINNAIHLEIEREVWEAWGAARPAGLTYEDLEQRMQTVKRDLGVDAAVSAEYSGCRAQAFVDACAAAGVPVAPLPVSILGSPGQPDTNGCAACGSDNIVDPFGQHTGGLHPPRPAGPNSYLMRALQAGAQVAWQLRAWQFQLAAADGGNASHAVSRLVCEDLRGRRPNQQGPCVPVFADQFVLAAGAIASTGIVARTAQKNCLRVRGLGEALTANVVTPVYAVFDREICPPSHQRAEPGVAQCYYVRRVVDSSGKEIEEPALENWFHYPGSLAIAITGWFAQYVDVMRKYDHLSVCGMVVPTKVRPSNRIDPDGRVHLEIDRDEFELLLRGIRKIGRIYLAAATPENGVSIHLPTRAVLLDRCDRPVTIRSEWQLDWALEQIRCRGPAFLSLATAHPQGGNALGAVVDTRTFRLQDDCQRTVDNLYVADASLFPAGCEVNPQLTVKALASCVADQLLQPPVDA